jgi:hypothetical protein
MRSNSLDQCREALALCGPAGYTRTMAQCLEGIAAIAAAWGQPERAAQLAGASAAMREDNGLPLEQDGHADVDRTVAAARGAR